MKIIERTALDAQKWDALVERSGGTVFSCSFYLDAVAENWSVIVDEDYSAGMALPYTIRLEQRTLYTPVFVRYLEWFGNKFDGLESMIREHFKRADLSLRTPLLGNGNELVYQEILLGAEWKTNELTGRMLKKFAKSEMVLTYQEEDKILDLINEQLPKKIDSLDEKVLFRFKKLKENLLAHGILKSVALFKDDEFLGGAYFILFNDRTLYLKSAFVDQAKKSGGMYAVMCEQISSALDQNQSFDFGGSRVASVRQFNHNLGGSDTVYFQYQWDHSPIWFKVLLKVRRLLKGGKPNSIQKS